MSFFFLFLKISFNLCASINQEYSAIIQRLKLLCVISGCAIRKLAGGHRSSNCSQIEQMIFTPSWWSVKRRRPLKSTKDWTVQNSWKAQMFQTAIVSWINGNGRHSETISIRLLFIIAINSWGRLKFMFIRIFFPNFYSESSPKSNTSSRFSRVSFDEKQRVIKRPLG